MKAKGWSPVKSACENRLSVLGKLEGRSESGSHVSEAGLELAMS